MTFYMHFIYRKVINDSTLCRHLKCVQSINIRKGKNYKRKIDVYAITFVLNAAV